MNRCKRTLFASLAVVAGVLTAAPDVRGAGLPEARIFFEYNSTDNDLGVHVFLDAEDWKTVKIVHPDGGTIFEVTGRGGFGEFGMTELFFEGAEPSLNEVPLEKLLQRFPEGRYTFNATTVAGRRLTSRPTLSHAVPAGPAVSSQVNGSSVVISWEPVNGPPPGFPPEEIAIVAWQVIVGSFQVTLPASTLSVMLPEQFVGSLASGTQGFEVLAIDQSGNQTITAGSFVIP